MIIETVAIVIFSILVVNIGSMITPAFLVAIAVMCMVIHRRYHYHLHS